MFIPLYDGKPVQHIALQWVTLGIIGLNIIVYCAVNLGAAGSDQDPGFYFLAFGHVPSVSYDLRVLPSAHQIVPDQLYFLTTITSAFLHTDFLHLAGNMLFLWVFGDNVEDAMGHIRYAAFYVLCAIGAAWFHAFVFQNADGPLIGASGATAGVVAAYLMLHPRMRIWILFLSRIPLKLSAWIVLGGWVIFQFVMFLTDLDGMISWAAHVGGILVGAVLVVILKRRSVPLFDREVIIPGAVAIEPSAELPPAVKPSPWGRNAKGNVS